MFTPYSKKLNDEVLEYFKGEGFEITSNSYFDIEADYDIGKVDQDYLYEVLSKLIYMEQKLYLFHVQHYLYYR